ncbi:hypothetical protein BDW59DRAFT_160995 [Aspergillus cavernicola]|uniref:Uncharacterized protein n=1 Tax=Aspergillus cavernicola TaxID=176166 RepID=A0ABR4IFF5_9EURO
MTSFNISTEGKTVIETWGTSITGKTVVITGPSKGSLEALSSIRLASAYPSI